MRDEWLADDPDGWIDANPLYAGGDFSLGCGNWDPYILTTKQTRFVETLLQARGKRFLGGGWVVEEEECYGKKGRRTVPSYHLISSHPIALITPPNRHPPPPREDFWVGLRTQDGRAGPAGKAGPRTGGAGRGGGAGGGGKPVCVCVCVGWGWWGC